MSIVTMSLVFMLGAAASLASHKLWRGLQHPTHNFDHARYAENADHVRATWALARTRPTLVMLGDSITAGGAWHELTGCATVATRALGSEHSAHLARRIGDIIALRPSAVVLMIGVNDLSLGTPAATTAQRIAEIISKLQRSGIKVYRLPVLPVTADYKDDNRLTNAAIGRLNEAIDAATGSKPDLDLRPLLSDAAGNLRADVSKDGIHLSAAGFAIWRDAMAPIVEQHC